MNLHLLWMKAQSKWKKVINNIIIKDSRAMMITLKCLNNHFTKDQYWMKYQKQYKVEQKRNKRKYAGRE